MLLFDCLGAGRSDQSCSPASIPGFRVILRIGGRTFECYSGDPVLTDELAVAYVKPIRDKGTAAPGKTATALYLRTLGGAGDIKWMFDDDAAG